MEESLRKEQLDRWDSRNQIFWYFMDGFLLMAWNLLAGIFAAFAILTALYLFRYTKRGFDDLAATTGTNCWVAMGASWLASEIHNSDQMIVLAKFFFFLGAMFVVPLAIKAELTGDYSVLNRFRRFKRRWLSD